MRNTIFAFVVVMMGTALMSCQKGFESDPLAKYPAPVREGIPPELETVDDREPVPRNAVVIQVEPEIPEFVEGKAGEISLEGRLIDLEGFGEFELVEGPDDMVLEDRKLLWTPGLDTLVSAQEFKTIPVTVAYNVTTSRGKGRIEKTFNVYVERQQAQRPKIWSIDGIPDSLKVGEKVKFAILVEDRSAIDGEQIYDPPEIQFLAAPPGNSWDRHHNGATLIRTVNHPIHDDFAGDIWIYEFEIKTDDVSFFDDDKKFKIAVQAISRFGVASTPKTESFRIYPSLPKPKITWRSAYHPEATPGQFFSHTFDVYSLYSSGYFNITITGCPDGASCKCTGWGSSRQCRVTWKPVASQASTSFPIKFKARHTASNLGSQEETWTRTIKVGRAPVVAPAPACPDADENGGQ